MEIRAATGDLTAIQADAVIVNLFEGTTEPGGATGVVDKALGGVIGELMRDGDIKGKRGELTLIHTQGKIPSKRVIVAGLGKQERLDADAVRGVSAEVARFLRRKGIKKAASVVHGAGAGELPPDDSAQAIAEGMQAMKTDMAGGAAVIAAMQAVARFKPAINVLAFVPTTENMPGGGAQKPGDLLVAMNGKTVEVENTDAEGRLILADALSWAHRLDLRPVISVATLTGAISVTLGKVAAGVFANNQEVADRSIAAGKRAGEKMWQLPMWEEYKELNKSTVADLKNTGGRLAGSIAAAQFLHEFIEETPWAHLDIAGVATTESEKGWEPRGATGQPVRSLINFVLDYAEQR